MNRQALVTFAGNEFAKLLATAEITAADSAAGLGPAVDATLRQLGVVEGSLASASVPSGDEQGALDLMAYFSLRRIVRQLAALVDLEVDAPRVRQARSQAFAQASRLFELVQGDVATLGYAVGGQAGALQMGRLMLDMLEPDGTGS